MKVIKNCIIPEEWKDDLDSTLKEELVSANRYFARENPNLKKWIKKKSQLSPEKFFSELKRRWEWHHEFYEELLEPALPLLLEENIFSLSPRQIKLIREAYLVGSLVDQATIIFSGGIKKHLENWIPSFVKKYSLKEEELDLLLGLSPIETYDSQYLADHLEYLAMRKRKDKNVESKRDFLIEEYHAGIPEIFEMRFSQNRLKDYQERTISQLQEDIKKLKSGKEKRDKVIYIILERPDLKAVRKIIKYDTNEERKIMRELIGISGFVLRKKVLKYLVESKILPTMNDIYYYSDEVVSNGLKKLLRYREEVLNKQVKPLQQNGLVCSATCLTMAAKYFNLLKGKKREFEEKVAYRSQSNYIEGQHYSGVAKQALEIGLEVVLVHSSPNLFKNEKESISSEMFKKLMREYNNYLENIKENPQFQLKIDRDLSSATVKKYLQEGYLVILAGMHASKSFLHSLLFKGYNSRGYLFIDPLYGREKVMTGDRVDSFMRTDIGKWLLAVRPKWTNLEKLEKEISTFKRKALQKITR